MEREGKGTSWKERGIGKEGRKREKKEMERVKKEEERKGNKRTSEH